MKKLNIIYVVHSLEIGGLEKCVVDLVNGLDRKIFKPMICCLTRSGPSALKIRDKNVPIFEMNKKSGNDIMLPFRMARLFRQEQVDIVHSGNWGTMLESVCAAKMAGISTVIHMEQGMELNDLEQVPAIKKILRGAVKFICSFGIKVIVTVSSDLKNYVHHTTWIKKDKIKVIYNSVDTQKYAHGRINREKVRSHFMLKNSDILIGSVGRLADVKNYSSLISAMKQVIETCPEAKLFIIGDGPLREKLEKQIIDSGLEQNISLLGQRSDIPDMLGAMDIYVLPSIFEGISISILEAMAAGLPVVATRVGGNPEIILNGETGYLVELRNSENLARKIIKLVQNKKKRALFSKAAVQRVNNVFHIDAMVSSYAKLYLE